MKKLLSLLLLIVAASAAQAQTAPCPSGDTCGSGVTFTVTFQAPSAPSSVSPSTVVAGAGATLITLAPTSGNTFNSSMVILLCQQTPTACTTATALPTTLSGANLTATIPATALASSGTVLVYIAQPNSGHAANLNWTPGATDATHSAASSFNVKRAATLAGPYATIGTSAVPSFTDTALLAGANLCWAVSAVNSGGESANSSAVCATIPSP